MNSRLILLLTAAAATVGAFAYARRNPQSVVPKLADEVKNWENEGGNVPSVPSPSPAH